MGLWKAARAGNLEAVEFFVAKGAKDLNSSLAGAVSASKWNTTVWLVENGATNYDEALLWCLTSHSPHWEMSEYFVGLGAKFTIQVMDTVTRWNKRMCLRFIQSLQCDIETTKRIPMNDNMSLTMCLKHVSDQKWDTKDHVNGVPVGTLIHQMRRQTRHSDMEVF